MIHPKDVIAHPDWIGRELTVDIIEPLYDSEHSSGAAPGEYDVEVSDVGATRFKLVPGKLSRLPAPLHPPQRVTGRLESTRFGVQLSVTSLSPLPLPTPSHLASAADLLADRARWSGQYVEIEDDYFAGFEASIFGHGDDGAIWLSTYPDSEVICPPPARKGHHDSESHIRVTGWAYTSGQYGHMGLAQAEIIATKIEYLKPRNCKK